MKLYNQALTTDSAI